MQHAAGMSSVLADELVVWTWEAQDQLRPGAEGKDVEHVHKMPKVQAERPPHPGTAVVRKELQDASGMISGCLYDTGTLEEVASSGRSGLLGACQRGAVTSLLSHTEDCRLLDLSSQRTDTPSSFITTNAICKAPQDRVIQLPSFTPPTWLVLPQTVGQAVPVHLVLAGGLDGLHNGHQSFDIGDLQAGALHTLCHHLAQLY